MSARSRGPGRGRAGLRYRVLFRVAGPRTRYRTHDPGHRPLRHRHRDRRARNLGSSNHGAAEVSSARGSASGSTGCGLSGCGQGQDPPGGRLAAPVAGVALDRQGASRLLGRRPTGRRRREGPRRARRGRRTRSNRKPRRTVTANGLSRHGRSRRRPGCRARLARRQSDQRFGLTVVEGGLDRQRPGVLEPGGRPVGWPSRPWIPARTLRTLISMRRSPISWATVSASSAHVAATSRRPASVCTPGQVVQRVGDAGPVADRPVQRQAGGEVPERVVEPTHPPHRAAQVAEIGGVAGARLRTAVRRPATGGTPRRPPSTGRPCRVRRPGCSARRARRLTRPHSR